MSTLSQTQGNTHTQSWTKQGNRSKTDILCLQRQFPNSLRSIKKMRRMTHIPHRETLKWWNKKRKKGVHVHDWWIPWSLRDQCRHPGAGQAHRSPVLSPGWGWSLAALAPPASAQGLPESWLPPASPQDTSIPCHIKTHINTRSHHDPYEHQVTSRHTSTPGHITSTPGHIETHINTSHIKTHINTRSHQDTTPGHVRTLQTSGHVKRQKHQPLSRQTPGHVKTHKDQLMSRQTQTTQTPGHVKTHKDQLMSRQTQTPGHGETHTIHTDIKTQISGQIKKQNKKPSSH